MIRHRGSSVFLNFVQSLQFLGSLHHGMKFGVKESTYSNETRNLTTSAQRVAHVELPPNRPLSNRFEIPAFALREIMPVG